MSQGPLLTFPCDLPIKVLGRNVSSFRNATLAIINSHYGDIDRGCVAEQPSREGRFLSLTVTVRAESREQIDAVYRALTASDEILMVL